MSRIIKIALAAAVIIFVAAYLFVYNSEGTTKAVVVQSPISDTTEITSSMITVKNLPVSAVPKGVVTSPDEVIGKMVTVGRVPGDLIPRSIVVTPEDVALNADEVLLTIQIPPTDNVLTQFDKKILLALYGTGNQPPVIVDGIEIYQIKSAVSGATGQQQQYAVIKTTADKAKLIMPYIVAGSYRILSNKGQPLPEQTAAENQTGQAEQKSSAADDSKTRLIEYYNGLAARYKELADAYSSQQKTKNAETWKSWSDQWLSNLASLREKYEKASYDSSVNIPFQQLKSSADALNRLWTAYNASVTGSSQSVDVNGPKSDYDKYMGAAASSLGLK